MALEEINNRQQLGDATRSGVPIDTLEVFVELLSRVQESGSSDAFYSRLCEAVCRLAHMDRAIIFRYDEARRRVRAVGAHNLDLAVFADELFTVESAPLARRALEEDRVIEIDQVDGAEVPERFRELLHGNWTLVCTPLAAGGLWNGVILCDRGPGPRPLSDEERHLLWTLGKTAGLVNVARIATRQQSKARELGERIDLARDVHESVIQRLFGVSLVLSSNTDLDGEARSRCSSELQAALKDLRRALQRPLGRSSPETQTTLLEEIQRLRREHPDLGLVLAPGAANVKVPSQLEPLAQSVLAEAVRNAHKHAHPSRVEVALSHQEGALVMEVVNDGVRIRAKRKLGMGLRLAALEALQAGGIVEFGEREPETWRVRLAVPLDGI
ncbi:MAG: GAF domain-containing protein [Actinomycetota bacterium]|nr:GAF domain-containing protein [Actinomycetota bacterium]